MTTMEIEHAVVAKLRTLPAEKQQEVLDFADFLVQKSTDKPGATTKKPRISSEGILAGLNIHLKEEDLAEVRREMWANFPRDIALSDKDEQK